MNSQRRKPYINCNVKEYEELQNFFPKEINFSKNYNCDEIIKHSCSEELNVYRVWLLFASNDEEKWDCLQVAHSKNIQKEIKENITSLFSKFNYNIKETSYSNSAFYEKVCPKLKTVKYRELLYSRIGDQYKHFKICLLDVDGYLELKTDNNKTDVNHILQICKNQYAEAKIAYQTLALYWRLYSSGIDGQTIDYIVKNDSEFNK